MGKKQSAINQLSLEQKRKLLAKLEQKKKQKKQLFPLSFAQARLWFLDRLQPGTAAYNIPVALELKGKLNLLTLKNSLNEIVQRHEILRTIFIGFDDEPKQKIIQSLTLDIPLIDLQELSKEHQEIEIQTNIKTEALRSFNLEKSPLLRSIIFQRDQEDYVLIFTVHHIIADYWSMRVLIQELAAIYEAFSQQKPSPLPSLPIQYADFAVWQRKWLQGEARVKQLEYWREKLRNNPPILQLPTDFPRPPIQTFQGTTEEFFLSLELSNTLKKVSRQAGTTLFMTLLAAFKVLLYRYTGQDDILVGSTVANRNRTEIENLIGLFVNNLVFRTEITSNISFWDFLTQVKEVALGAYAHQDLPFEYLVEVLQPERNLSHNPLFQVMFILHNTPSEKVRLPGLSLNTLSWENQTSRFDLSLDMYETSSGLRGVFEYNTGLFKGTTIKRLIKHFKTLLQEIVNAPEEKISQLNLLTSSEQKELFIQGRREQGAGSREIYIHQLFETQVKKSPNKIAVIFNNESLTYQQLNQKANQLAHYLQRLGVKPETLVGICLDPSLDMVISLLAILKAGGAYLPLDPNYPEQRLDFMIKDSGIDYLIKGSEGDFVLLRSGVRNSESVKYLIDINKVQGEINQEKKTNLDVDINLDNLAYIIYTSGSTGIPKGVQIPHRALSNFLVSMSEKPGLTDDDTLLSVTTLSFDIAALELYLPLIVGAKLVLVPRTVAQDGVTLGQQLESHQVTVMQGTPATWKLLLASGWEGKKDLTIFCGGEALDPSLGQHLQQKSRAVWNLYGPTETTIWSSVYQVTSDKVRLGKPINNTQFYVLDKDYNQVPIGVPGELYIGGMGVARGYLNRPKLTAERFMAIPSTPLERGGKAGSRLYKTGDLVKYGEDGEIEYLGRTDYQLKLRGFRLELGEIETILLTHPQVKEAVVIVKEESLIAYIVSTHTPPLKDFLAEKLPSYMIPSRFIELDSLPLTPNGKIDRNALPEIELNHKDYIAPKTATEEILAGIWANILNLNQVSVEDNFFELGGHSLLATRVMSQVRQVFERELPLRILFEKPTIRSLSNAIDGEGKQEILSFQKIDRHGELPLSFAQQRQWFLSQLEPDSPFYNIPGAVRLTGKLNISLLQESLNEVVGRHEVLRSCIKTVDGKPQLIISPTITLNLPIIDLRDTPNSEEAAKKLAVKEAKQPFKLAQTPLLRVKLFQLAEQDYILLLVLHHSVADAWSVGIFIQEVAALYQAFSQQKPSPLPELPIQYLDFAAWQREWLQGETLDTQLAYWRTQLNNAPTLLKIPSDRPRPPVQTFHGKTLTFQLSQQQSDGLKQLSQQHNSTLFMVLLAAFNVLLHRYTHSEDIIVGSPIANRNRSEIEGLIGFFANTLALRSHLSGTMTFVQLLQQVRETTLGAYSHQDLPFEQLVDALQPERDLSYTSLFQVMFVLQNIPMQSLELPGLSLQSVKPESTTAKFDLTLFMTETAEGLIGTFEYNTDLFEDSRIRRLAQHFQTLITGIIANPQQQLWQLPLGVGSVGSMESLERVEGLIHELFEEQVKRTPDAIALIHETQELTYQDLNHQANQLAHYLQQLGVKPETPVGVCLNRSPQLIVVLLGILKAGGAYLPLDPNYPSERLALMMEDAQIPILITQGNISQPPGVTIIDLEVDQDKIIQQALINPSSELLPENLAYLIYTSGSTGRPKGVAIAHRSTVALLYWAKETFTAEQLSGVLASTSVCFDLSVFEIFVPLSWGGTVILAENALALAELPHAEKVTLVNTVPTAATELLRLNAIPNSVKTINLAGEALSKHLVQQLYQNSPIEQVFNLYGPSEDTTYSTVALIDPEAQQSPSIGVAITNTEAYILDAYLQPVPLGVPGELYLGGEGLARGYLHQPILTAERFIPIPSTPLSKRGQGAIEGSRLYRTGDRVRLREDGHIEYLGRIDNQVKVRGFRIELGEVEENLLKYPAISQAVTTVKEDNAGNKRLVAYLVMESMDQLLEEAKLRHFLQQSLPDYMVPSLYLVLKELPLMPNGKVNRKALPEPQINTDETKTFIAPQTAQQESLALIWSQVLGCDRISIHDNFFALGGDSILAIQVVAKANQIGLKLTPKDLFQHQTMAELASVLDQISSTIYAEQETITGVVPLTPIQHWFFEQNLSDPHHWNQAILLEIQQRVDPQNLQQAIAKLLEHHDALRLRFEPTELGWQQINNSFNEVIPFIEIDFSTLPDQGLELAISRAATQLQSSFSLNSDPLIRVAWFNLGNHRSSRLLLIMHHLVIDGISWRIFLEDLQTAYRQLNQNKTILLPPKTTSFKYWVERLQTYANSELLQGKLSNWIKLFQDPIPSLPVDFPTGKNTMAEAKTLSITLSQEDTQRLLQEIPSRYQTQINEVLIAALVQTFEALTGQHKLLIELEGHGREDLFEDINLSRTIGWFTTLFPVVFDLSQAETFLESIIQIKEQLNNIPDHGIGYGILRYLGNEAIQKQLKSLPQADIRFNYFGQFDRLFPSESPFKPAPESSGTARSPHDRRSSLIEINSLIINHQLRVDWTYSRSMYRQTTIDNLMQNFSQILRQMIDYCLFSEDRNYTPLDFPKMDFTQEELEDFLSDLE
ncbi:peptide synthetase [Crocosphaera subtropica ATCC 51142]|uniref:Peptide synthetase n=1 Tax=Crocosphaera subtropica (strain ATCC 51142 / BH68) TaxID=43989 RepID=B1WWU9_CROS5|nr:non-ribosomal peptide synthetase [Crocosphaera subtropica]ACB52418.1 peptide synthetase [Crocosphaera subtropica ATCC 51142]